MRHFQASAVERRIFVEDTLETHPIEAGWASEALFFLWIEEVEGTHAQLTAEVQLSPDGINWIFEGTTLEPMLAPGHYFARVSHFGNWLRIKVAVTGQDARFKLSVHLHLKE